MPNMEMLEGGTEGLDLKPWENSQWSLTMDEQIMAWATNKPEVSQGTRHVLSATLDI